ncbi:MAG: hypothetical protein H7836_04565 [Magnetococcus sp. YQC-3]
MTPNMQLSVYSLAKELHEIFGGDFDEWEFASHESYLQLSKDGILDITSISFPIQHPALPCIVRNFLVKGWTECFKLEIYSENK